MFLKIKDAFFVRVLGTGLRWYCRLPHPLRQHFRNAVEKNTGVRVTVECIQDTP